MITPQGLAAVVDRHLGDRIKRYSVYADEAEGASARITERSVEVRLKGANRRDTFLVTVYPPGGSEGQVVKGRCDEIGAPADPKARTTCFATPGGGNVTITRFTFGLSEGNRKGSYLTASGNGPEEREATAAYESFAKKMPLTNAELNELLGDPYLGWETDPKFNAAGESLKVKVLKG